MSEPPKPVLAILNLVFGAVFHVISHFVRSKPFGSAPTLDEFGLLLVAYGTFCTYYEVWDCIESGQGGGKKFFEKNPSELTKTQIYFKRAQFNQVEQFPFFVVSTLSCAVFVSPLLAGISAVAWVVLRMKYSQTYRANAEKDVKGIGSYTVPCYIILGANAGASLLAGVRFLVGI